MKKGVIFSMAVVFAAIIIGGCAKVPQTAIDEARAAIDSAKASGAETYCAEKFKSAQGSLDLAIAEIENQNSKSALMRVYDNTLELLKSATAAANSAKADVETSKERIRASAQDLIVQATMLADSTSAIIAAAQKAKKVIGTVPTDLDSARVTLTAASAALSAGDIIPSQESARIALDRIVVIRKSVEDAIAPGVAATK